MVQYHILTLFAPFYKAIYTYFIVGKQLRMSFLFEMRYGHHMKPILHEKLFFFFFTLISCHLGGHSCRVLFFASRCFMLSEAAFSIFADRSFQWNLVYSLLSSHDKSVCCYHTTPVLLTFCYINK